MERELSTNELQALDEFSHHTVFTDAEFSAFFDQYPLSKLLCDLKRQDLEDPLVQKILAVAETIIRDTGSLKCLCKFPETFDFFKWISELPAHPIQLALAETLVILVQSKTLSVREVLSLLLCFIGSPRFDIAMAADNAVIQMCDSESSLAVLDAVYSRVPHKFSKDEVSFRWYSLLARVSCISEKTFGYASRNCLKVFEDFRLNYEDHLTTKVMLDFLVQMMEKPFCTDWVVAHTVVSILLKAPLAADVDPNLQMYEDEMTVLWSHLLINYPDKVELTCDIVKKSLAYLQSRPSLKEKHPYDLVYMTLLGSCIESDTLSKVQGLDPEYALKLVRGVIVMLNSFDSADVETLQLALALVRMYPSSGVWCSGPKPEMQSLLENSIANQLIQIRKKHTKHQALVDDILQKLVAWSPVAAKYLMSNLDFMETLCKPVLHPSLVAKDSRRGLVSELLKSSKEADIIEIIGPELHQKLNRFINDPYAFQRDPKLQTKVA